MTTNGRLSGLRIVSAAILMIPFVLFAFAAPASAGELTYFGAEGAYTVHLTTLKELRFRTVIRQQYDFSCGSAALATLLTYDYRIPVKETDVFVDMWKHGDQRKIKREGFSMLDMQEYLHRHGISSNGYRSSLDRLLKAQVPAVVLLKINNYLHFTIVEGIDNGRVLLADPALGTRAISVDDFKAHWNGIFFVILDHPDIGHQAFNRKSDWSTQPAAPIELARNMTNLATLLMSLPGRNTIAQ